MPKFDLERSCNAQRRFFVGMTMPCAGLRGQSVGLQEPSMSSWRPSICPREHFVSLRGTRVTLEWFSVGLMGPDLV